MRSAYQSLTPLDRIARYPRAILGEVQKRPALFDTLKSRYDQSGNPRYMLPGSSAFLLWKTAWPAIFLTMTFQELLEQYEWSPITGCPGRYQDSRQ